MEAIIFSTSSMPTIAPFTVASMSIVERSVKADHGSHQHSAFEDEFVQYSREKCSRKPLHHVIAHQNLCICSFVLGEVQIRSLSCHFIIKYLQILPSSFNTGTSAHSASTSVNLFLYFAYCFSTSWKGLHLDPAAARIKSQMVRSISPDGNRIAKDVFMVAIPTSCNSFLMGSRP